MRLGSERYLHLNERGPITAAAPAKLPSVTLLSSSPNASVLALPTVKAASSVFMVDIDAATLGPVATRYGYFRRFGRQKAC